MIAEEPVIPYDGRRVMCDGTHGGVAKEQVETNVKYKLYYITYFNKLLRVILECGSIWMTVKFTIALTAVFDIKRRRLMMPHLLLPPTLLQLRHNFN